MTKKNSHCRANLFLVVLLVIDFPVVGFGSTSDATILRIQGEISAGRIGNAEAEIKAALRNNPQDGGVYNLLGIVHANRNEMKEAAAAFTQAVRFSPRLVAAYLNLGRAYEMLSSNDPNAIDLATAQYRRLLKLEPASHEVRLQLAKSLANLGQYQASLNEVALLGGSERAGAFAIALRCADLAALHQPKEAKAAAQALIATADLNEQVVDAVLPILVKNNANSTVIEMLNMLDQRQPLSNANLRELAAAYERCSELPDARRLLERIVSTDANNVPALLELARVAQKENDLNGALGYLAHARDLNPDYASVHFFFGVVCIELDLPVEAKKSLQKALDLDPENPIYNYARGSVELQSRSAWQAIPYFKKFVAAKPADQRGHFALGAAEYYSQDYETAANEMNLAALSKETAAGAEYFLGRIAKAEGDWQAAAEHLQKSIDADSAYADSHAELGLARMHLDDLIGARKELDRALALNPDSYIANGNLLALFKRTQDPRAAAQEERLRNLDLKRSEKQELMVRTIGIDRYTN